MNSTWSLTSKTFNNVTRIHETKNYTQDKFSNRLYRSLQDLSNRNGISMFHSLNSQICTKTTYPSSKESVQPTEDRFLGDALFSYPLESKTSYEAESTNVFDSKTEFSSVSHKCSKTRSSLKENSRNAILQVESTPCTRHDDFRDELWPPYFISATKTNKRTNTSKDTEVQKEERHNESMRNKSELSYSDFNKNTNSRMMLIRIEKKELDLVAQNQKSLCSKYDMSQPTESSYISKSPSQISRMFQHGLQDKENSNLNAKSDSIHRPIDTLQTQFTENNITQRQYSITNDNLQQKKELSLICNEKENNFSKDLTMEADGFEILAGRNYNARNSNFSDTSFYESASNISIHRENNESEYFGSTVTSAPLEFDNCKSIVEDSSESTLESGSNDVRNHVSSSNYFNTFASLSTTKVIYDLEEDRETYKQAYSMAKTGKKTKHGSPKGEIGRRNANSDLNRDNSMRKIYLEHKENDFAGISVDDLERKIIKNRTMHTKDDRNDANACCVLTNVHSQLISNRRRAERLHGATEKLILNTYITPAEVIQLLSKTISRCKSYIHRRQNCEDSIARINMSLLKNALSLKEAVKEEHTFLKKYEEHFTAINSVPYEKRQAHQKLMNRITSASDTRKNKITNLITCISSLILSIMDESEEKENIKESSGLNMNGGDNRNKTDVLRARSIKGKAAAQNKMNVILNQSKQNSSRQKSRPVNNVQPVWKPAGVVRIPSSNSVTLNHNRRPSRCIHGKEKDNPTSDRINKKNVLEYTHLKKSSTNANGKNFAFREERAPKIFNCLPETKIQRGTKAGNSKDLSGEICSTIEMSYSSGFERCDPGMTKSGSDASLKARPKCRARPGTPRAIFKHRDETLRVLEEAIEITTPKAFAVHKSREQLSSTEKSHMEIPEEEPTRDVDGNATKLKPINKDSSLIYELPANAREQKRNADMVGIADIEKDILPSEIMDNTENILRSSLYRSSMSVGNGSCVTEFSSTSCSMAKLISTKCCQTSVNSISMISLNLSENRERNKSVTTRLKNVSHGFLTENQPLQWDCEKNIVEQSLSALENARNNETPMNKHMNLFNTSKEFLCDENVNIGPENKVKNNLEVKSTISIDNPTNLAEIASDIETKNSSFAWPLSLQSDMFQIPCKHGTENNRCSNTKDRNDMFSQTSLQWVKSKSSQTDSHRKASISSIKYETAEKWTKSSLMDIRHVGINCHGECDEKYRSRTVNECKNISSMTEDMRKSTSDIYTETKQIVRLSRLVATECDKLETKSVITEIAGDRKYEDGWSQTVILRNRRKNSSCTTSPNYPVEYINRHDDCHRSPSEENDDNSVGSIEEIREQSDARYVVRPSETLNSWSSDSVSSFSSLSMQAARKSRTNEPNVQFENESVPMYIYRVSRKVFETLQTAELCARNIYGGMEMFKQCTEGKGMGRRCNCEQACTLNMRDTVSISDTTNKDDRDNNQYSIAAWLNKVGSIKSNHNKDDYISVSNSQHAGKYASLLPDRKRSEIFKSGVIDIPSNPIGQCLKIAVKPNSNDDIASIFKQVEESAGDSISLDEVQIRHNQFPEERESDLIISEVKSLVEFLLHRMEEEFARDEINRMYHVQKNSVEHLQKDEKTGTALIEVARPAPEFSIVTKENLLRLVYGVVCSIVFWCLQFSIGCESGRMTN